jgi:cation:H+ antiporter
MAARSRLGHPLVIFFGAFLLTFPWIAVWATGVSHDLATLTRVAVSGVAVLGASFLLAWGAETAEKDVPRAFAIAVLAVLAVAPEYAVDALYAWNAGAQAGTPAGTEAANLAVANMTGANRILIGLGWSGIALFAFYRARSAGLTPNVVSTDSFMGDYVELDRDISLEILFLFLATVFAFFVPLSGGIDAIDTIVLVAIYVAYIAIIIRGEVEEHGQQVGVPAYFHARRRGVRVPAALFLFVYSGALIFTAVEPFAHGLEQLGIDYGIPKFFMIQWVAPLASESPELIVTAYLVNKARSTAAFNALISSKLNQWTLLIGTLAVVYSIALGGYGVLSFDQKQAAEIWITAAQSLFALVLLIDFRISAREAVALLVLFVSQVVVEFVVIRTVASEALAEIYSIWLLYGYTGVYLLASAVLLVYYFDDLRQVVAHAADIIEEAWRGGGEQPAD